MKQDLRIEQIKKKGFTLVELLISISIIAVLSIVLTISFSNAQKNGRDQRRISDLKAIQNAAEQYHLLSGSYPVASYYRPTASAWTVNGQVVLNKFPSDPKNISGVGVTYTVTNTTTSVYCVCATVENTKNSNALFNDCSDMLNAGSYFCIKNQQ